MTEPPHFRSTHRRPVSVRVRFRKDEPSSMLEHVGTMSDVGVGGAFVATSAEMPVGTRIVLIVPSPTAWEPLEVSATVRWISGGGGEPAGFGVRFDALSGREATALYELVHASAYSEPDIE